MSAYGKAVEKVGEGVYRISVSQEQYEVTAYATLVGVLADACGRSFANVRRVILSFPQTSLSWRTRHGGPDILAIPEYTVPCMIQDVLWFSRHGIEVDVEQPTDYRRE
jgi:hypothetical protein